MIGRNPHPRRPKFGGPINFCHGFQPIVSPSETGARDPMFSARQFIGAATTALSLITGAFLRALAAGNARAQGSAPACDAAGEIAFLPSPWAPWKGAPLRVMLVTESRFKGSSR